MTVPVVVTDIEADLRDRWVPSQAQVAEANRTLNMFPQLTEVYSLHLLVNKRRHFWTEDVVVEYLPGVHFARETALKLLEILTESYHATSGLPVVGGYTVHSVHSDFAVYEDGVSSYPKAVR
jgi:hypothetical protein